MPRLSCIPTVYSLVKHGGVRNYIAITWTPENLEACADLNLPCADVAGMLLEPLSEPCLPDRLSSAWPLLECWLFPLLLLLMAQALPGGAASA